MEHTPSFKEELFLRKFLSLKVSLLTMMIFAFSLALLPGTSFASTHPKAKSPTPQSVSCGTYVGWVFDSGVNQGEHIWQFGPTYTNFNGTGSTVSMTLTATQGGTMTITASASVEVDANAVLAGAKATVGASLSVSLTASSSNAITFNVPSHQYGHGQYGIWYFTVYGHYYYYNAPTCSIIQDDGYLDFYVPSGQGWNIWTSTN